MSESVTQSINEKLRFCDAGYAYGLIGEANQRWLKENIGTDFLHFGHLYRLGAVVHFQAPVTDSRKFGEFLEAINGLEDYPIICEDTFSQILMENEDKWIEEFAKENGVSFDAVAEAINGIEGYFEWELDYVYPAFDEAEVLDMAKKKLQTWNAHYYSGEFHYPEACTYCAESLIGIGA